MIDEFEKPTYVGVVFDMDDFLSGNRFALEEIKKNIADFTTKIGINARVYVAGNENIPNTHGESVFQIFSYLYAKDNLSLVSKFRDCINGIGSQQEANKIVFLITNRFSKNKPSQYRKGFKINQTMAYGCKIFAFEFRRHNQGLIDMSNEFGAEYMHIDDISSFSIILNNILKEISHG